MLLYFITTDKGQLVIAKSDKGVTERNRVKKINVRLKEIRNGDTVKQLLKLFVLAVNIKDVIARHIYLTHLYTKFLELDEDNVEVQKYFFDVWAKSLLKSCHLILPECVNHDAIRKALKSKSVEKANENNKEKKKSKKTSLLTKHTRRK